ncbi:MAG: SDR family oxidoreductase, partial [Planctomycetota bacterium]
MSGAQPRYVLVTGSSGGIGSAICSVFHDAGWRVIGVDRCRVPSEAVDDFIESDISDPEAPAAIFDRVRSQTNRLDALVNNAATQVCKPITVSHSSGVVSMIGLQTCVASMTSSSRTSPTRRLRRRS